MTRTTYIESYFTFELTTEPASLFKDGFMRKPDKAKLKSELLQGINSVSSVLPETCFVIDGGHLLHAVKWHPDGTYVDIACQYEEH
jgi:hypothetical protein